MDNRNFRYSIGLKSAAFVIAVLTLITTVGSAVIWAYCTDTGYKKGGDFFETDDFYHIVSLIAEDAVNTYESSDNIDLSELEYFSERNTNVSVEIFKKDSKTHEYVSVAKNFELAHVDFTKDYYTEHCYDDYESEYKVRCSVSRTLTANDSVSRFKTIFDLVSSYMDYYLPVAVASLIIWIICFIYLMFAAGRKSGCSEVKKTFWEKIPLDIYAAAVVTAVIFVLCLVGSLFWEIYNNFVIIYLLIFIGAVGLVSAVLITGFFMTLAVRIKTGGWWKNSVIYLFIDKVLIRLLKKCRDIGNYLLKAIPVAWKLAVVVFIVSFSIIAIASLGAEGAFCAMIIAFFVVVASLYCGEWMKELKKGAEELASGNDSYRVNTERMKLDFKEHGESLNSIGNGIQIAVSQRMKSERMKTELITNVSHDLKTPLTSIINYVDLLHKEELNETAAEYVDVLKRQCDKLKKLTDDIVDASKASTGNIPVKLENIDGVEIIEQVAGEYRSKLEKENLELVIKNETEKELLNISADGRLLWRAMDNLMNNISKYSQPSTRVYINISEEEDWVKFTFKNISKEELNISAEELMERFVRGDSSRSTEGSGLGLNIAKSLVELQNGKFALIVDGDLFKAEIKMPIF